MEKRIQAIKAEFLLAKEETIADIIDKYQEDSRAGVQSLIEKYKLARIAVI